MTRSPPVVVHVPHASVVIPEDLRPQFLLSEAALAREVLRMTDHFTDELFAFPPEVATTVRFPVSRLVVDPERFVDDAQERMAARGMGVAYTRTADGQPLRTLSAEARGALLARFYEPHHAALTAAVNATLDQHGRCLVVDAHSFPSAPLPYEDDQRLDRPQVCIGTDAFHTPPALRDAAVEAFIAAGFSVEVDRPFSGALVPLAHFQRDTRVSALMVELNRGLYLDEEDGHRLARFEEVRTRVRTALEVVFAQPGGSW